MKRVIRVFPRRTRATPTDDLAIVGRGPELFDEADEVHVSVTFTWDMPFAEKLAEAWKPVASVLTGGPATGERGEDFVPGMYLKHGYVITSRGCPNRCWFCAVWKREGNYVRELPIRDGYNVLDDNVLACGREHINALALSLGRQKQRPEFTGGLEAKRLEQWHVDLLRQLHPKQIFFAYDTQDDLEYIRQAGEMLQEIGLGLTRGGKPSHRLRCYVLCGWPKDTLDAAATRMAEAMDAGFTPMAMAWRGQDGKRSPEWARFQRKWARPAIVHSIAPATGERRCAE